MPKHTDMKKHTLIIATLLLTGMWSCKKEDVNGLKENSGAQPGMVSNIAVKNENGAATITYSLPNDEDLLYVKAVYTLANGSKQEVKASYYTNQLRVAGFADTLKHTVNIGIRISRHFRSACRMIISKLGVQ